MHDVDVGGWVPSASATARVGIFHVPYTHRTRTARRWPRACIDVLEYNLMTLVRCGADASGERHRHHYDVHPIHFQKKRQVDSAGARPSHRERAEARRAHLRYMASRVLPSTPNTCMVHTDSLMHCPDRDSPIPAAARHTPPSK